jgi:tRNA (guanine37-N1)-methyltransferase
MRFDVLTIFPDLFASFLRESLIGKALAAALFEVEVTDIRDFTADRHRTVDDRPFGGGPGMVMKPEPLVAAVESVRSRAGPADSLTVLLTPAGRPLTQAKVRAMAGLDQLILVCGRYEGVDQRVTELVVDEELSVGDYVLSGGEIPAMLVIEAVARLLPGVVGKFESTQDDTFSAGLLEYPHYTRPRTFRGLSAPEVLLSGDHARVRTWRLEQAIRRTRARRPDLLDGADLTENERQALEKIQNDS